jgi:hypothetical protein
MFLTLCMLLTWLPGLARADAPDDDAIAYVEEASPVDADETSAAILPEVSEEAATLSEVSDEIEPRSEANDSEIPVDTIRKTSSISPAAEAVADTVVLFEDGTYRSIDAADMGTQAEEAAVSLYGSENYVTLDGITYALGDSTATVSGYTADIPAVCTIPASITVDGVCYAVTSIAASGLYNCSAITSLTLPEGLISINENSLAGCTAMTTLHLPSTVTFFPYTALTSCTNLSSITVASENPYYWSQDGVLFEQTTLFLYPQNRPGKNYTVPDGVTEIEDYAFTQVRNLTHVTLSDSVKTIGSSAFFCSSLETIDLASVQTILSRAFARCASLKQITIPATLTRLDSSVFFNDDELASFQVEAGNPTFFTEGNALYCTDYTSNLTTTFDYGTSFFTLVAYAPASTDSQIVVDSRTKAIAYGAFWDASNLTSIVLSEGLLYVGSGAFTGTGIYTLSLPDSVVELGAYAFQNCSDLHTVDLGTIATIPYGLFSNCTALTTITIPAETTTIPTSAFSGCSALQEVLVEEGNTSFSSVQGALYNAAQTTLLFYPSGSTNASFTIPATVTLVNYGAFSSAENLCSITVAEGNKKYYAVDGVLFEYTGVVSSVSEDLSDIGFYSSEETTIDLGVSLHTFPAGKAVSTYTVPDAVTTLAPRCFFEHRFLRSLDISNVRYIRSKALHGSGLETITLQDSLLRIGTLALCGTNPTSLRLPASLVFLGSQALDYCWNLEYITFAGTTPPEATYFAYNSDVLRYVYVPVSNDNSVQAAYLAALGSNTVYPGAMIVSGDYQSLQTVQAQISSLSSASGTDAVNTAAINLVRLTASDMTAISDEKLTTLDDLFAEGNHIQENTSVSEAASVSVFAQGLALASGLTEKVANGTIAGENTVTLTVEEETPAYSELLHLNFAMTVNDDAAQPVSPVLITIPFTEEMEALGDHLELVHISDEGEEEAVNFTVSEDNQTVSFRATSFSSYVFRNTDAPTAALYEDAPTGAILIVAQYQDGQMVQISIYDVSSANGAQEIAVQEGLTCRAFLLDPQYCPVGTVQIYSN